MVGLIKAFRASNIANAYQLKSGIIRQTATMDFPDRMGRGEQDMEFRENFAAYLRPIDGQLQMSLVGIVPGGELQIHMIMRGGHRQKESTMRREREMIRRGHFERLSVRS